MMRLTALILSVVCLAVSTLGQSFWQYSTSGQVNCLACDAGVMYAGTKGDGVYRSTNNGLTWNKASGGLGGANIIALAVNLQGSVFAGTTSGLFRSNDRGNTWTRVNGEPGSLDIRSICVVQGSGSMLVGAWGMYVYRSTDNGNNWSQVKSGIDRPYVISFCVDSHSRIFCGTNSNVYRSTDDGASWLKVVVNLTPNYVLSLAANPSDEVFAGTSDRGIYCSTDAGLTWNTVNSGYDINDLVNALSIDSNRQMFAGSGGGGVYRSTNKGASWTRINDGLNTSNISSVVVNSQGYLFAGSSESGVYRSAVSITSVYSTASERPESLVLSQNYPNPFNPSTTIRFALPRKEYVSLRIFNGLGEVVSSLVDEDKEGGVHQVRWNAIGFPSGVYFCRLVAGSFSSTTKLILVR